MRAAVIPTHNRHADLHACVESIYLQVDEIHIIDNDSDPYIGEDDFWDIEDLNSRRLNIIGDPEQPPNLSRLWKCGIQEACSVLPRHPGHTPLRLAGETTWVAILNDDAVVPMGWFTAVQEAMEATGAVLGWSDPFGNVAAGATKFRQTSPASVYDRVCGWAFMLRYPGAPMPDINLRWYYGDSQLDFQAARSGGCVAVGGYPVINKHPGASTVGELARQSGLDRAYFIANYEEPAW